MQSKKIKLKPGEKLNKGYLVVFTSWENDGDHYRNVQINVKTKAEAMVLIQIAKMFDSKETCFQPKLGNEEHDFDELKESIVETLKETITDEDQKVALKTYIDTVWAGMDGADFYGWLIDNILHCPVEYEYGFCREIEEFELYEVEEDFVMPDPELPIRKVE